MKPDISDERLAAATDEQLARIEAGEDPHAVLAADVIAEPTDALTEPGPRAPTSSNPQATRGSVPPKVAAVVILVTLGSCGMCFRAALKDDDETPALAATVPMSAPTSPPVPPRPMPVPDSSAPEQLAAYVLEKLPALSACEKECILSNMTTRGFVSDDFALCLEDLSRAPQGTCEASLPKTALTMASVWKTRTEVDRLAQTFPTRAPDLLGETMKSHCDARVRQAEAEVAHLHCAQRWRAGDCTTAEMNNLQSEAASLKVSNTLEFRKINTLATPRTGTDADIDAAAVVRKRITSLYAECTHERVEPIYKAAQPDRRP